MKSAAKTTNEFHLPVVPLTRPFFAGLYYLHVLLREGIIHLGRLIWFEPLFRSQCEKVGRGFRMEQLPYITGIGRIVVGSHVRLSGKSSFGFANLGRTTPTLEIGDLSFIGHNCTFLVANAITIGKHCLIAGGVRVSDYDGHPLDFHGRRRNEPPSFDSSRPVTIGDDVWIGAGSHLLKGVHIGDRSIIGAGSVVTKDVPPDVVVAGNPASIVKALTYGASASEAPETKD